MHIIKSIRIKKFRSIFNQKIDLNDLTIFSGKNNSGKSNVLKALNLFFNAQSGFNQDYSYDKDYNKAYTHAAGGKREIEITLFFYGKGGSALSEDFEISRKFTRSGVGEYKYHSKNNETQKDIDNGNGNITRQFTTFLNKLQYIYVPVVRDKNFIRFLFAFFENLLENNQGAEFRKHLSELSEVLRDKSAGIGNDFEGFLDLKTKATLSTSITEILNAIVIEVDSGIKIQPNRNQGKGRTRPVFVDLFSTGDGVLMSYVPHFLSHICKKVSKKNFIWGFEEPENSLEYSRAESLSDKFHDDFGASNGSQILLTTHSPAFIRLKDKNNVNLCRVYNEPNDVTRASEIKTLEDMQKELFNNPHSIFLEQELGFVEMSQELEGFYKDWESKRKEEEAEKDTLIEELKNSFPDKVFICEDAKIVDFWQTTLKDNGIKVLSSDGVDSDIVEIAFLQKLTERSDYKPIIFRQIDRDGFTGEQIAIVEKKKTEKYAGKFEKYKLIALPVNAIENFALMTQENTTEFTKIIDSNKDTIEDKTRETIGARVKAVNNMFGREEKAFHNEKKLDDYGKIITKMLENARENKLHFFKGKEIAKKKQDFNAIRYLRSLNHSKYPQELQNYIQEIKDFFE